ncbi:MAG: hypothetical protein NC337_10585 [Roseburia sp.]|nr:hypothetical protein [Roseburia sp.]
MGSAAAFMITGSATKITNLGAVKIVLGMKHFIFYIAFVMLFFAACWDVGKFGYMKNVKFQEV